MDKLKIMKTCSKCNLVKEDFDFYKPQKSSICKSCHLISTRNYKREKRKDSNYKKTESLKQKERRVRLWQQTLLHDCKSRKHDFNLDVDYINHLFELQNGKCYWFGVELTPSPIKKNPNQPSLDRLDNKKGYIKGNVVLSCYSANIGRNETDEKNWIDFVKKIKPNITD